MKTQTELLYEAYNSVYLTEDEQYCQDIAEFLLNEGFTEEEIFHLTKEDNFFEIVENIAEAKQLELLKKTKDGYAARSMTPSAIRKQKGVPVEGGKREKEQPPKKSEPSPGQLSLNLSGKKPSRSLPSTRTPSASERRIGSGTSRRGTVSRNERNREYPGNTSSKSAKTNRRLKELESEVERDWPSIKKQQEFQMPPKTAVRQAKDYVAARAQQDIEKVRKAGKVVGALASGLFGRAVASEKVKGARVAQGRNVSPEVEKRYKRKEGYRAIKKALGEDYFDIVIDYLLENFEFDSEEHLLQTMTYIDEETIDEIVEGYKGLPKEKMQRKIDSVQNNLIDLYKGNQRPYDSREQTYGNRPNTSQILKNQQRFSKLNNTLSSHNWGDAFGKQLRNKKSGAEKGVRQKMRINPRNNVMPFRRNMKEDYFDIIADYLLENFEFESEQHLLQTMTYIDDDLIDEIISFII